ncbi:MAG: hypothetical protein OEY55_14570, partial [Acidimicrobiia bacterium]|nr:hypothetical protein [Acidimicrobiia bacterium]
DYEWKDDPVWWLAAFAPQIDPKYAIAPSEIKGAEHLGSLSYVQWLGRGDASVRLYRLPDS